MSAPMGQKRVRKRSAAEDAALWRRFRGDLGESVKPSASQWLKVITSPSPDYDWSLFSHLAPRDALRAQALLSGVWRAGTERYQISTGSVPWTIEGASLHFMDRIHRFEWLPHMAGEGKSGTERALNLVDGWIESHGKFNGFSWRMGPTADRIWNWMRIGHIVFGDPDADAAKVRLQSLRRQVAHLESLIDSTHDIDGRFRAATINAVLAIISPENDQLPDALDRLDKECTAQILPDGGHVSRSPERLLRSLLDLLSVRDALRQKQLEQPEFLTKWLPRMGAMLNFLKCDDGGLFPFNDSGEALPEQLTVALGALDSAPRNFTFSPKSGFQKLERGNLRLILDVGLAPDQPFGDMAHAGALGFELADGDSRIVTSCGYSAEVGIEVQAAVRRTGAHSTLVLGGRDNAHFVTNDGSGLLSPEGPNGISAKRLEESDEIWLDSQHSGYRETFGLLHRRRLFMDGAGTRLTGEDSLVRPVARETASDDRPIGFEIRFHLHPTVTALMARGSILLECASGVRWRFKTSHPGTRLEKSLYLARGTVETPEQIVITGRADPNGDGSQPPNCVRWAFLRELGT